MNRRSSDRRKGERPSFTKAHLALTSLTLLVSSLSLAVSLNNRAILSQTVSGIVTPLEEKSEEITPPIEKKSAVVQKYRSNSETKRSASKERLGRPPKKIRVIFDESVARAPAAVPQAEHQPKKIKYSDDIYDSEDFIQ